MENFEKGCKVAMLIWESYLQLIGMKKSDIVLVERLTGIYSLFGIY